MSSIMDALGVGPELSFGGKVYRLAPLTLVHYALFSAWLERRAYDSVERSEPQLSPKNFDRALAAVARDVASGVYDFGSEVYARASASMDGLKYLTLLSLRENQPDADEELVDKIFAEKVKQVMLLTAQKEGGGPKP